MGSQKSNKNQKEEKVISNSIETLMQGLSSPETVTGSSPLAGYSTVAYNTNYSLITLNYNQLTYLYSSQGLVQTIIHRPIQDALAKGIEIESQELSSEQITELLTFMERTNQWETLQKAWGWARLYGGGSLLINTNQDPSTPLNLASLHNSSLEFYDKDRWQLTSIGGLEETGIPPYFYLQGTQIDSSRVIPIKGKSAPEYQRQQLQGWGLSEIEHVLPPLNLFLKTGNVILEVLDEAKVDVYKVDGLNKSLLTCPDKAKETLKIVRLVNLMKSFTCGVVIDKNDEFETKSQSFAGIAEILREIRVNFAGAVGFPQTKLYGEATTGFNSGESDLESYNQIVESTVRAPMRPVLRRMLELNMYHLWGKTYDFSIKWPSLRAPNSLEEQQVKDLKFERLMRAYEKNLMTKEEWQEQVQADNIFSINWEKKTTPDPNPQLADNSPKIEIPKKVSIKRIDNSSGPSTPPLAGLKKFFKKTRSKSPKVS